MMVSSPPFLWPCYFGTDVPVREQLIAYNRTVEEIRQVIGADSLALSEYLRDYRPCPAIRASVRDVSPESTRLNRQRKISVATMKNKGPVQ